MTAQAWKGESSAMSPEMLAEKLARKARRSPLTPEQLSRALETEDFDLAGLDALYEALKARGVALAPDLLGEEMWRLACRCMAGYGPRAREEEARLLAMHPAFADDPEVIV